MQGTGREDLKSEIKDTKDMGDARMMEGNQATTPVTWKNWAQEYVKKYEEEGRQMQGGEETGNAREWKKDYDHGKTEKKAGQTGIQEVECGQDSGSKKNWTESIANDMSPV